jgi:hypothetical protein
MRRRGGGGVWRRVGLACGLVCGVAWALALSGCVETSECRTDGQCAVNQSCHRGYCRDVCKTKIIGASGREEAVSLRCSSQTVQRCVCVQTVEGNACSDGEAQVCNPTVDDYCLCFDEEADCNPRCREPQEVCVRGACVRQTGS